MNGWSYGLKMCLFPTTTSCPWMMPHTWQLYQDCFTQPGCTSTWLNSHNMNHLIRPRSMILIWISVSLGLLQWIVSAWTMTWHSTLMSPQIRFTIPYCESELLSPPKRGWSQPHSKGKAATIQKATATVLGSKKTSGAASKKGGGVGGQAKVEPKVLECEYFQAWCHVPLMFYG